MKSKRLSRSGSELAVPGGLCAECGLWGSLRPYGDAEKWICYSCGNLDRKATEKRMDAWWLKQFEKR